ncbi:MAG TPA: hypothetical protein VE641_20335, partial [Chthoniobacterales bacterium]|nr:hypothetical protein [Chthoniobacterales bacterium]
MTQAELESFLTEIASQEDRGRSFRRSTAYESDRIVAVYESVLENDNIPVIGPGGRYFVYRNSAPEDDYGFEIDLVVRKRLAPLASQWRQTAELFAAVNRQIAERVADEDDLVISAAFGYFELSKYELQTLLRPAFLISL